MGTVMTTTVDVLKIGAELELERSIEEALVLDGVGTSEETMTEVATELSAVDCEELAEENLGAP